MYEYECLETVKLFEGFIDLTANQAGPRSLALSHVDQNTYLINREVHFKAGERITLHEPISRSLEKKVLRINPDVVVSDQIGSEEAVALSAEETPKNSIEQEEPPRLGLHAKAGKGKK